MLHDKAQQAVKPATKSTVVTARFGRRRVPAWRGWVISNRLCSRVEERPLVHIQEISGRDCLVKCTIWPGVLHSVIVTERGSLLSVKTEWRSSTQSLDWSNKYFNIIDGE